ncbi:hypothetical protein M8494_10985 [Serratia ureilytica]
MAQASNLLARRLLPERSTGRRPAARLRAAGENAAHCRVANVHPRLDAEADHRWLRRLVCRSVASACRNRFANSDNVTRFCITDVSDQPSGKAPYPEGLFPSRDGRRVPDA